MALRDGYLRHSINRGAERHGLDLTFREHADLSARIGFHEITGELECVRLSTVSHGREKWAIWYKGEWLPLIFDPEQARIVTLLPLAELRRFRQVLPW